MRTTIKFTHNPRKGFQATIGGKKYDGENEGWGRLVGMLCVAGAKIRVERRKLGYRR